MFNCELNLNKSSDRFIMGSGWYYGKLYLGELDHYEHMFSTVKVKTKLKYARQPKEFKFRVLSFRIVYVYV